MVILLSASVAESMVVIYTDGRPTRILTPLRTDSVDYFRLDGIASALGGSWAWAPMIRRASIRVETDSVAVTADSPFFVTNGRELVLRNPVLYKQGFMWVPREFFAIMTPHLKNVLANVNSSSDTVSVGTLACDIHVASFHQDSVTASLNLIIPSNATWAISPLRNDTCSVSILGAVLCSDEFDTLDIAWPLRRIETHQALGRSVISMRLSTSDVSVHARQPSGGGVLTITVETSQSPTPPKNVKARDESRIIIIDPGHGGTDGGVSDTRGNREKEITLALARSAAELLRRRQPDVDVLLTRDTDMNLGLMDRIETANSWGGALFISLHCNASFNRSMKGFQLFFLSPSQTNGARAVAAKENAVVSLEKAESVHDDSSLVFIPWDMASERWLMASVTLAESITEAAKRRLDTKIHEPEQAGLYVLTGCDMPSVLAEIGYLSNAVEARKLRDERYLEQIALVLAEGIESYLMSLEESDAIIDPPDTQQLPDW